MPQHTSPHNTAGVLPLPNSSTPNTGPCSGVLSTTCSTTQERRNTPHYSTVALFSAVLSTTLSTTHRTTQHWSRVLASYQLTQWRYGSVARFELVSTSASCFSKFILAPLLFCPESLWSSFISFYGKKSWTARDRLPVLKFLVEIIQYLELFSNREFV